MNKAQSLRPMWIGLACMLGGVLVIWLTFHLGRGATQQVVDTTVTTPVTENDSTGGTACIQVITPAKNLTTGEVVDYPTPCDVPEGWEVVAK